MRLRHGNVFRRATAVLAALLTGSALTGPAPAAAEPVDPYPIVTATVWAHSPTTAEYQPGWGYTVNSTDGAVTIQRTGVGAYRVILAEAATIGGITHVVPYGGGPTICTVAGSYPVLNGTDHIILVRCFGAGGAAVDSRFVATFTNVRQISQGRLAYFSIDQAVPTGVRTLPASLRYDSTGGTISYERLSVGRYRYYKNPNPASENGPIFPMVHVTAYGTSAVHCQADWPDGGEVYCTNAAGQPVDARFAVTYGSRVDLVGRATGTRFASGTLYRDWISGGSIGGDSYNSTLPGYGGASGTVLGTGRYQMTFQGTGTSYGTAFVNAHRGMFASDPHGYCVLAGWSPVGTAESIRVNCYTYLGVPTNLNARISFTTWPVT
ncbi:hypothetical protein GCM10027290_49990 [Micromonospora sonneratiae]|uniref:Uncharacterized protein n=1 Tax=Micromonospora sonneratiae TaxID=1184706 RepID=A0ABW3YIZ0_9ACTN